MSSSNKCGGCKNIIRSKEFLICSTCKTKFDLLCINLSDRRFNRMNKETKRNWQCPECSNKLPKEGNTITPVRAIRSDSPTNSLDTSVSSICDAVGMTKSNSQQQTASHIDSNITLQDIRRLFKEEVSEIVRNQVTQELEAIKCSLDFFNEKYEELRNKLDNKIDIITKLESDNQALRTTLRDVLSRLSITEQQMRENNLEINGIPENRSENLKNVFLQLANTINCPINDNEVIHISRIAKVAKDNDRPRTVIVKLHSQLSRDSILAAVSTFNKNKNIPDKLNSHHLGIGGTRKAVFVAEHLTLENKRIHAATRIKCKELNYKFVWVRNGRIFARKDESHSALFIRNLDSLKLIT